MIEETKARKPHRIPYEEWQKLTPEEQAEHKHKLDEHLETQDAANYWGGYSVPTPTTKEHEARQLRHSQHDRDWVWMALSACADETGKRTAQAAYEVMCKWHNEDNRIPRIPPTMITRWKREFAEERIKFLASTRAVDCYEDLLDRCTLWSTLQSTAKDLLDRAYGQPTKKVEVQAAIMDWSEVEKRSKEDKVQYASGEWTEGGEDATV